MSPKLNSEPPPDKYERATTSSPFHVFSSEPSTGVFQS